MLDIEYEVSKKTEFCFFSSEESWLFECALDSYDMKC